MNLMVLNRDLDAIAVIDSYESFIWTDRYDESGDFELYTAMDKSLLEYIKQDNYIINSDSEHVMIIEKLLITSDSENGNRIKVTGRSLESILDRRIIWGLLSVSGNMQEAIKKILDSNCIAPTDEARKIPNLIFEYSADPIVMGCTVEAQYTGDNVYEVIQSLCASTELGFKITLNANKQFVFKLYAGVDRTYAQTAVPYVIFSPKFDNIINSNYMETKANLKNVTLVGGEGEGSERRYYSAQTTGTYGTGLDRRELFTDARDISSSIGKGIVVDYSNAAWDWSVYICVYNGTNVSGSNFAPMIRVVTDSDDTYDMYGEFNLLNNIATTTTINGVTFTVEEDKTVTLDGTATADTWLYISNKAHSSTNIVAGRYILSGCPSQSDGNEKYRLEWQINNGASLNYFDFGKEVVAPEDIYNNWLTQRGTEKLAENISVTSFEGETETTIMFRYGEDFFNGDIVQIANEYGHETISRIVEIVISENSDGRYVYPTFRTLTEGEA